MESNQKSRPCCRPLTSCYGREVGTTGRLLLFDLSVCDEGKQWPDCTVQVRKIHPADATARWDDTRPESLEIQRAPLMATQFVWQWLSGDGALVDVICQPYAHLTQQLRPWGSRESVVMLLQLKKLKWQVLGFFVCCTSWQRTFFLISKSHKTTPRLSGRVGSWFLFWFQIIDVFHFCFTLNDSRVK